VAIQVLKIDLKSLLLNKAKFADFYNKSWHDGTLLLYAVSDSKKILPK